jgi:phytoene dehydrogenase-like protein
VALRPFHGGQVGGTLDEPVDGVPGLSRPEPPIENLYLAGASAHPGGGVHGASGWNAARACLANHGLFGGLRRRSVSAVLDRLYRDRVE